MVNKKAALLHDAWASVVGYCVIFIVVFIVRRDLFDGRADILNLARMMAVGECIGEPV